MENLCSIFHDRHDRLKLLTGSPAKAEFLSKCLFWWQISTYKIKNSVDTWFTQTTEELATKSGLSTRTITRYLSFFAMQDLIEKKIVKRFSKKHQHEITCLHIRITDKLIAFIKMTENKEDNPTLSIQDNKEVCQNLPQVGAPGIDKLAHPLNKDNIYKYKNNNNNVRKQNSVNFVDKKIKTHFPIEKVIGERVTEEVKDHVKGMMVNVLKEGKVKISNPEQIFAEINFSLLNTQQFRGIDCFKHKINIIASILKKNGWKTPYGFYKYWDVGQTFKERNEVLSRKLLEEKQSNTDKYKATFSQKDNILANRDSYQKKIDVELEEINKTICLVGEQLLYMEKAIKMQDTILTTKAIEEQSKKLSALYQRQTELENSLYSNKEEILYA